MKNDRLTRRHILTAAGACLVAAAVPPIVTATTIPPEVTAFGPDAVRLWETGSPAARRMVERVVIATDEQLDWLIGVLDEQAAVIAQGDAA